MITNNKFLLVISFLIGTILTSFFIEFNNLGFTDITWFIKYDTLSNFLALKLFLFKFKK